MMTERERLYELIVDADNEFFRETPYGTAQERIEKTVEYLLANGVILPPCKVGDTVWLVFTPKHPANPSDKGKWFMVQDGVQRLLYGAKGISVETWNMGTYAENKIGKTVFLTREDAEAELEKRRKEGNTT